MKNIFRDGSKFNGHPRAETIDRGAKTFFQKKIGGGYFYRKKLGGGDFY